jgi:PTS system N-acetylglucosamine-specific IIC component
MLAGFGFSAGLFDMVLNWGLATNPIALVVMGLVYFGVYFGIFYTLIRVMNLKTPGREDETEVATATAGEGEASPQAAAGKSTKGDLAANYAHLLGGFDNMTKIDACITRLRLTLKDTSLVDEAGIKALGAAAVVRIGSNNIQVVIGPEAEIIADEMKSLSPAV